MAGEVTSSGREDMNKATAAISAMACISALSWPGAATQAQPSDAAPGSPRWFFDVTAERPADPRSTEHQVYVQNLVAAGREDLLAGLDGPMQLLPAECDLRPSGDRSIVEQLAERASTTTIVIVNEAHDTPKHREFTRQLAAALRDRGYTHFAAETFSPAIGHNPGEPFGRGDAGYYATEPAFGNLIRTVKELGYTLVAYEQTDAQRAPAGANAAAAVAAREEAQANNLIERIFAAEPQRKALIHVGYSHAAEVPLANFDTRFAWMAARLKAKTGVDPLTIDQIYCASPTEGLALAEPPSQLPAGAFDVAVAHPPTEFLRGRPQWRIDAGAIAVELPEQLVDESRRTLVEARHADEPPDAIPVDRLLLRPGERMPLLLPAGSLRLTQYYEDGAAPRSLILNVR
jgi:hypothetical protein